MDKYISVIGIILVMFGTIFSVWSVLGTNPKDVGTAGWNDNQQKNFEKDKKKVIAGTIQIILGTLFQIVGTLM